jgi:hypothetical protein
LNEVDGNLAVVARSLGRIGLMREFDKLAGDLRHDPWKDDMERGAAEEGAIAVGDAC